MTETGLLSRYSAFLLDVDGVLVRGLDPIPGSTTGFTELQRVGDVMILTNNSTRSRQEHALRLTERGFPVTAEQVISSNYIAARYLLDEFGPVSVWPVGESGLREELRLAGHQIAATPSDAMWVVAGMDRQVNYHVLGEALQALAGGACLLATNQDGTYPTPEGLHPGAGAIVGAMSGMGFPPQMLAGKPAALGYQIAEERLGLPSERLLMIGDRLGTDIAGAQAAGIDSALVLTGISSLENIELEGIRPTWVSESLAELARGRLDRFSA